MIKKEVRNNPEESNIETSNTPRSGCSYLCSVIALKVANKLEKTESTKLGYTPEALHNINHKSKGNKIEVSISKSKLR